MFIISNSIHQRGNRNQINNRFQPKANPLFIKSKYPRNHHIDPIFSIPKSYQISQNHQNIQHSHPSKTHIFHALIPPQVIKFSLIPIHFYPHFDNHTQANSPCPQYQTHIQIMPDSYKGKHYPYIQKFVPATPTRNKHIPYKPYIETLMPCSPESFKSGIIAYTSVHIFRYLYPIKKGP